MSLSTYLILNIRVCGTESISLISGASRFFISGIVLGDVSTMSDATRYYSISQSTFQTWFSVSPTNDACTIANYELYTTLSPLVPWPVSDT